ncbi:hypothetical protein HDA40_002096 [Hamadaea flava]|uniref:Uncharacterized protein n=1 Tax=Hamadaea flava TaxID=1742688 RepID=A0ABV8LLI8_9ACTN|nr:hypothetical protein [Hamadaea flava]MCP2323589.1 hypothetical protein [Hamadaea flava]
MGSTWVASVGHLGGDYRMLLCAQGSTYLHVALEGPPLTADMADEQSGPHFPDVIVEGESWRPHGRFSLGRANIAGRSFDRTLFSGFFPLPPDEVERLSLEVIGSGTGDAGQGQVRDEKRKLFATEFGRHSRPLPGSDLWQPRHASASDGYRLLGAGEGQDVFYIFCEAPAPASTDRRSAGEPAGDLTYTLFFDDEEQQPLPDRVFPARLGSRQEPDVALLVIMVARRARTPREFGLVLVDQTTKARVFDIEAHRH